MKKKACILTVARAEYDFAPIWYSYYSRFFDSEDMYCLINKEGDTSFEGFDINVEYKETNLKVGLHQALINNTTQKIKQLFEKYEWVIFTETDEIIIPNPQIYKNFADIFNSETNQRCCGYNLIQGELESAYNREHSILSQRKFWKRMTGFDKTLILNQPVKYDLGYHTCTPTTSSNKDISLIHLHYFDRDIMLNKLSRTREFDWGNEAKGSGVQNKSDDKVALNRVDLYRTQCTAIPKELVVDSQTGEYII
jgi:hypothetical protein